MADAATTCDPKADEQTFAGPSLVVRLEKETVGCYRLDKPRLVMGRSRRADLVLDESGGVSREHAHVLVIDDEVVVEDLGSRNGTYVNGKPTTRRTLRAGDRIAIGRYRLRFLDRKGKKATARTEADAKIQALLDGWKRPAALAAGPACPLCRHDRGKDRTDSLMLSRTLRALKPDTDAILARVDALMDAPAPRRKEGAWTPGAHRLYDKLKARNPKRPRALSPRTRLQRTRGRRPPPPST